MVVNINLSILGGYKVNEAITAEKTPEELDSRLNKLKEERFSLLNQIKKIENRFEYKSYELKAVRDIIASKKDEPSLPPARFLKKELDELEFRIATEALTLKHERDMMKKIKAAEEKLKKAIEKERVHRKAGYVEEDLKKIEDEYSRVKSRIREIEHEMDALKDAMWEHKKKEKLKGAVVRKKQKLLEDKAKRLEEYARQQTEDNRVSLGEICVIKKKGE